MCSRWCDYGRWVHFRELSTGSAQGGGIEWARHMYDITFSPEYRVWQEDEWLRSDSAGLGYALADVADADGRGVTGLVMPLQKLGAVLRRRHGRLGHACADCMIGAAPEAADLITAAEVCESPFCERKPEDACRCCAAAFCRGCLASGGYATPGPACDHGTWPAVYSQAAGQAGEADVPYRMAGRLSEDGVCVLCREERTHALRMEAARVFEQEYMVRLARVAGPDGEPAFAVPAASRLTSGGRLKETRQSREAARGYAAEIARRAAVAVAAGPCRRSRTLAADGRYAPHTGYVLVAAAKPDLRFLS